MNRKEWLKNMGLSGLVIASGNFRILKSDEKPPISNRVLRIAHITDPHIHPGGNSEFWTRECIRHIQSLDDKPDIIFNGGDSINDALRQDEESVIEQWDIWDRVMSEEISLPLVSCIGNHDVWGVQEHLDDPRYGKQWAVEKLGLPNRYYSFDKAGWHFIVLDSTHKRDDGSWYTARLDDEQFAWLQSELENVPAGTPVFIFSHIPIMCAASFFDGDNEETGNWVIPGAWVHIDARRIVELFYNHKNVKVCISGHIHLLDKVVYNDVTYYCNGAVCGNWWRGNYHQTAPGYALINLYDDGSFTRDYVAYGWS
jgi:3',5'-cyclic-AMP phosphodiesterase